MIVNRDIFNVIFGGMNTAAPAKKGDKCVTQEFVNAGPQNMWGIVELAVPAPQASSGLVSALATSTIQFWVVELTMANFIVRFSAEGLAAPQSSPPESACRAPARPSHRPLALQHSR